MIPVENQQTVVDQIQALHEAIPPLDPSRIRPAPLEETVPSLARHLCTINGDRFDANRYFEVLTHLAMEPGYRLDYLYLHCRGTGQPIFHAVREGSDRPDPPSWDSLRGEGIYDYLSHVRFDGSPEGFVQFIILTMMGGQFYLRWHGSYTDTRLVCDREAVRRILATEACDADPKEKLRMLNRDVTPTVSLSRDTVTTRVVYFSRSGGFVKATYLITRELPNRFTGAERKTLMKFDCGKPV